MDLIPHLDMDDVFQSSPDPKVGCHQPSPSKTSTGASSFNPHPTRRSGATMTNVQAAAALNVFQSSPEPKVGCHVRHPPQQRLQKQVSILTRPEGRVPR